MDKVNKVLLFHDVDKTKRTGMQKSGSRYLLDWKKFQKIFELNQSFKNIFEQIVTDSSNNEACIRITIDDGGGSNLEIAKFLKERNIKGYFFIITNFIGRQNFLDENEIKQIHQMGHIIGSHSHTHPHPFSLLSYNQILFEINKSKEVLEQILNISIKTFSVPGGEVNNRVLKILSEPELALDDIYISAPFKGRINFRFSHKTTIYGRLCIESRMSDLKISRYLAGKGWFFSLIDYQIRRFKREIVYRLSSYIT